MTMTCRVCKEAKHEDQFAKKTVRPDGSILRNTICKPCQRIVSQKHYNENKKDYLAKNEKKKNELRKFMRDYKENSHCERCGLSGKAILKAWTSNTKKQKQRKKEFHILLHIAKKLLSKKLPNVTSTALTAKELLIQKENQLKDKIRKHDITSLLTILLITSFKVIIIYSTITNSKLHLHQKNRHHKLFCL